MLLIVADTSALVSLGVIGSHESNPLDILLASHRVIMPEHVVQELTATSSYNDEQGNAASEALERQSAFEIHVTDLDESFPLDDGENAAVSLANELEADQLLCDEFNQIALIHASLVTTKLVTTPTLIASLVQSKQLSKDTGKRFMEEISQCRSWDKNKYVQRANSLLDQ